MMRTTTIPFREWSWHKRVIERLYRWTHGGAIRTLVIREPVIGVGYSKEQQARGRKP